MTARLLGTLLLACAGAGLGACGAVRRQAVEKRIRLLSRLWTYLEELLTCRALTGPMLLHAAAENPAFAAQFGTGSSAVAVPPVSYTHLTLPTNVQV